MTIDFNLTECPPEYKKVVRRLRDYIDDTIAQNDLKGIEESTDFELYQAIEDTWDEINNTYDPVDLEFPTVMHIPWAVVRLGATINVLTSKGIRSARNILSYNDAGGINIKENDEFGRYTV